MTLAELTNLKELTHVVIVGVEPNDEYARSGDGWNEDVLGPFTEHEAADFAKKCEDLWKAERKRRRKDAFPYGEPFTKVRAIRMDDVANVALNWVKEG